MSERPDNLERLIELLSDRATGPLSDEEVRELDELVRTTPGADEIFASFDAVEGGLVEAVHAPGEPLPASLRESLIDAGRVEVARAGASSESQAPTPLAFASRTPGVQGAAVRGRWSMKLGWLAAAAALVLVAIFGQSWFRPGVLSPLTASERRASLVAQATDLATLTLTPAAGYESVVAEVVWSDARQEGYLRIRGLTAQNDPNLRYHIWITDAALSDQTPVIAGVFDGGALRVDPITGEAVIAIAAGRAIGQASAFSISLDPIGVSEPGQVVLRGLV